MVKSTGGRRAAVAVAAIAFVTLTACSSTEQQVRDLVSENYQKITEEGSYEAYRSGDSTDTVVSEIASTASPGRTHQDSTGEYLGYQDVMVHVEREPSGSGSQIEVTDAGDGYDRWGAAIVPVWGTFGGSYRNAFSGGGSGWGK